MTIPTRTTNNTLTAIAGVRVGHATHLEGATGCTVVLCPEGTIGGVDQRGGAPGTRETDLLRPSHHVHTVNAILLSGGSAFGLSAADGVMRFLEERGQGYRSGAGYVVPIVPAAILFDLTLGKQGIRPDSAMGYAACLAASDEPVEQGSVGAGTGCRIGAMYGNARATKGGVGSAYIAIDDELAVAALVAVNAVGDVLDEQGRILAGLRTDAASSQFVGMLEALRGTARTVAPATRDNTVIGVVATNARLSKEQVNKLAQMANNGVAQTIRPAHTMFDGDTMFALATGAVDANVSVVGAFAAEAVGQAIRRAVRAAKSVGEVRAISDF
ncbi:MAG: P1 family peptidase [Anaerolineae bacterium]|nr:P1 family peptidase [Anaerolineae bacterium]